MLTRRAAGQVWDKGSPEGELFASIEPPADINEVRNRGGPGRTGEKHPRSVPRAAGARASRRGKPPLPCRMGLNPSAGTSRPRAAVVMLPDADPPRRARTQVCVYDDSGLVLMATEQPRMHVYFVPALGAAPKWCTPDPEAPWGTLPPVAFPRSALPP